ncbi:MAG: methyl-accepting chemotaxis protein [Methylococcales bacterium]|nr:methyl-accepting chemotaxis protein [Methylococcales bacterium]MDD5753598.1 methyl-accepting chemotaxis protein [Methylococcales bacterium]
MKSEDKEIALDNNSIIVIRTDLQGIITYVNDEFVKISGFGREEVIEQNHSVIHHPDMPAGIFDDCLKSLALIYPWSGFLKNCTKAGDFYWTHTNAIAEFTNKGIVSNYLLVSFALKKGEREQAEILYAALKNKKTSLKKSAIYNVTSALSGISKNKKLALSLTGVLVPSVLVSYELLLLHNYLALAGIFISSIIAFINISAVHSLNTILDTSTALFYRLASKKFGNKFDLKKAGLVGDFYRGLFSMDVSLSLDIAESNRRNNESLRISNALSAVHSAIMVADMDYKIIFYNPSALQVFKNFEAQLKQKIPHFDISAILGSNIDIFHTDPKRQRDLLSKLTGNYEAEVVLGEHVMSTSTTTVFNHQGEKVGYVTEWIDKTNEIKAIQEITKVVEAASLGDFEIRISESDQRGFLLELSRNLNLLLGSVNDNLNELEIMLDGLAKGDLTQTITKDYQGVFGRVKISINTATESLNNIIVEIKDTTDIVSSAVKKIALSNNELSHRTEEQAVSLEETAASMHELTATVRYNGENMQQANILAVSATETASKGIAVIERVVDTMESINESSLRIVDIISVIDDIAFQTNILALNAAVEAARAGELGKGFAVVAIEVRNLAKRAANAAGEIKYLISNSVERVSGGSKQVATAGITMQEIVNAIQGVTGIISEIASTSNQQISGIFQIEQAITTMDNVTQQNATMTTEMATSAEALEKQTSHLTTEMSHFKTDNETLTSKSSNSMFIFEGEEYEYL